MDYTITERQTRYRNRMYKAGLKQINIWVKRKEPKKSEMSINEFNRKLRKMTEGWDKENLSWLLNLFIEIIYGKKEELKNRCKN